MSFLTILAAMLALRLANLWRWCALLLLLRLELAPAAAGSAESAPENLGGDAWKDVSNPIRQLFAGQRLDLWSLFAPKESHEPIRADALLRHGAHPVDVWWPAPRGVESGSSRTEASRRTLIRRLSFGLTGLPPSAEATEAFEGDVRPDAYERLLERLLASPHYGEHQARLWLDVVRYSDSNGFDWDEFRKEAWRFRDYVIRAFNADKPFDRFILEQLAGDELVAGPPQSPAEQDALIATGYLRLGPHDNAAPLFNEQDRSRAELLADLVETTGSAFLGLTLSCCRCHDHKTEPLAQADHYRLRAFFEAVKFADDMPLDLADEQTAIQHHNADLDRRLEPLERERTRGLDTVRERLRCERYANLTEEERAWLTQPPEAQAAELKGRREGVERKIQPSDKEILAALIPAERQHHDALGRELDSLRRQRRPFTHGLLMTDAPGAPPATHILALGNHKSPRGTVEPGFPTLFDPRPAVVRPAPNPRTTGRRLALAQWIASPTNPFTARVFVNRVWQQHFGQPLVATPNDFGYSGARPTHPELLDALSRDFVRSGWSVKQLHRRILTSALYRAEAGLAENLPLSSPRPPARRLSAEQLRDALLTVSGKLTSQTSGSPIWPELPTEVLTANPAFLDDNETRTKGWYPSAPQAQAARSVFLVQKRTVRVPFMETFDLPENSTSCARRTESTVAPQALSLLNGPLATEAARALAERVRREAGASAGVEAQVERAFRLALQRPPSAGEQKRSVEFVRRRQLVEFCRVLLNLNEFVYLD